MLFCFKKIRIETNYTHFPPLLGKFTQSNFTQRYKYKYGLGNRFAPLQHVMDFSYKIIFLNERELQNKLIDLLILCNLNVEVFVFCGNKHQLCLFLLDKLRELNKLIWSLNSLQLKCWISLNLSNKKRHNRCLFPQKTNTSTFKLQRIKRSN